MSLGEQTFALRDWRPASQPSAVQSVTQRFLEWKSGYAAANLIVVGRKPGAGAILMAANDYLSLARHPRIVRAITEALQNSSGDVLMSTVYVQHLDVQR